MPYLRERLDGLTQVLALAVQACIIAKVWSRSNCLLSLRDLSQLLDYIEAALGDMMPREANDQTFSLASTASGKGAPA